MRFRSHELALLEERLGAPVTAWFPNEETGNPGMLGMRFLTQAILVGVAHQFAGRRRRGGRKERLSPQVVGEWIDGSDFVTLLSGVAELVAMGLPGAAALIDEAEAAEAIAKRERPDDPLESGSDDETTPTAET